MNVFAIPSWYPEPARGLLGGTFLHEAFLAIARHHADVNLDVALWGQGDFELSGARARAWLARPHLVTAARPERRAVAPNLVEHYAPVWTWRFATRRGNAPAVLAVVRAQLERSRRERGRIDLIHAHVSFPAGWLAMRLSRDTGIPFVLTEHMSPFPFTHFVRDGRVVPEVAEPLRQARRVVAVSRALAAQIRDAVGVEPEVIPNGVDEDFFTPGPSRGGPFTFLTVGAIETQKGIDVLIAAAGQLQTNAGRAARFRVVGEGRFRGLYEQLARSLVLGNRFEWLGALPRERVRDEMRACDAFVLTSRHESFGVVYAEALACGKPVLATHCGGPEDIVGEGDGLLVPVDDVAATAEALDALARGDAAFDSAAIRASFERRFASRAVAARTVALYRAATEVA
ncbi:MAG: glycosyltransferase [Candidatus Eisenbacteria bacterium]|uniref:Glycosyltransferase n=1 Tax=Eiseniibacteriota bacterium TaxID=2212470 RepID=A0A933WAN5_UNCEI|nr:glycosyltransferase [Candidatus Eisenbacteria bacterium]